jgi:aminotransferase EvaB
MIKFWSYIREYKKNKKIFLSLINKTLLKGNIFFGTEVQNFEKKFLELYKFKYGIAVGSGTEALYIALKALNIGKDDEVLTVSNTAIPTASAIAATGAKPIFVDIADNYLINAQLIKEKITKKTKAILPVHLYGHPCDMVQIKKIANKFDLKIIEDCAQAQGATYNKKYVGSFGDLGCFSFYPTKILGAYGDGGFITCKSLKMYKKLKRISFYGIDNRNKYYASEKGINSRLDEIQSTILNYKIKKTFLAIKKRRELAEIYNNELKNTSLVLPKEIKGCKHVYHLYVVFHPKRDKIIKMLKKLKIETKINYEFPIHKMKAYSKNICSDCNCLKLTEKYSKGIFSLPLYPELKTSEIKYICKNLKKILINKKINIK